MSTSSNRGQVWLGRLAVALLSVGCALVLLSSPSTAQNISKLYATVTGTGAPIAVVAETDGSIDVHVTGGSGTLPAPGSDTYVLFNDGGNVGADSGMTYSKSADTLTVAIAQIGTLKVLDTGSDHYLSIVAGTNLTAARTLTITTGDAARTLTLSGNPTLADWFDQSVKAADSPTFAALTLTSATHSSFGSFGTTPATTGVVRLQNNQSIQSRDAANGANVHLLRLSSGDDIVLGGGSGKLSLNNNVAWAGTGNMFFSGTAPTISSGFGSSPSVTAGSATAFRVNVGTGGTAQNGVIALPTAATGWNCEAHDVTTPASFVTEQTASTTATATFQNYARTTGLGIAWTASDILAISCTAF